MPCGDERFGDRSSAKPVATLPRFVFERVRKETAQAGLQVGESGADDSSDLARTTAEEDFCDGQFSPRTGSPTAPSENHTQSQRGRLLSRSRAQIRRRDQED